MCDKQGNTIDGLKVFVKAELGLPLTEGEQELLSCYDEDETRLIYEFLNNRNMIDYVSDLKENLVKENGNSKIIVKSKG